MDKIGRGLGLAAALAVLGLTGSIARADDAAPPPHGSSLGIATSRLSDTWREKNAYRSSGVLVVGVDPSGRAAKGGITAGDVLVSVDGRTLREPSDLGYAERSIKADQPVPSCSRKTVATRSRCSTWVRSPPTNSRPRRS